MDKTTAIQYLVDARYELETGEKFKGRAALIKRIRKAEDFISRYKTEPSIRALIVQEVERELQQHKS